ncbi:phage holin family protein [Crassaminicella profunda]|uniref:phage holin family protein n=1 Tax=Crassaminicella profunda TaxID=1286698 RepID=UPI001CA638D7|nr:phage holin family protein [Crassaminicella profunda]QZY55107.1 phage holin family protein [Crassaminicella profunda]
MNLKITLNMILASLGTVMSTLIGEWNNIINILVVLMVTDYVTGLMKGMKNKEISSEIGHKGLLKKAAIFIVIILAHQIDLAAGGDNPVFRGMTIYFYIANEGISIMENLGVLGVPLPRFIVKVLEKMKKEHNEIG